MNTQTITRYSTLELYFTQFLLNIRCSNITSICVYMPQLFRLNAIIRGIPVPEIQMQQQRQTHTSLNSEVHVAIMITGVTIK